MQPALGILESEQALADVRERLERDHVLAVEGEHMEECPLGGVDVPQVEMAAAQDDARRYVIGVERQAGSEQVEGPLNLAVLPVHFGEGGEGESLRVLGVSTLELLDLAKCHPDPGLSRCESGVGGRRPSRCVGSQVRVASRPRPVNWVSPVAP